MEERERKYRHVKNAKTGPQNNWFEEMLKESNSLTMQIQTKA